PGAQPAHGTRRPRPPGAVPDPRSRREVPARLRRLPRERPNQGHPDARPSAERERAHGALGRNRPPRMPRPPADPGPPPARTQPPRLRQALQPAAAPPRPRPQPPETNPSTHAATT